MNHHQRSVLVISQVAVMDPEGHVVEAGVEVGLFNHLILCNIALVGVFNQTRFTLLPLCTIALF